jgi:hypothetical protein
LEDADGPKSAPGSIFPLQDFSNPYVANLPKSKQERAMSKEMQLEKQNDDL